MFSLAEWAGSRFVLVFSMAAEAAEIEAVKNSDIDASILLGFNPMTPGVE